MAKILVVTSGKGGVGKTTTSAAIGTGLALRGHKTVIVDFDVGLRNLDLIMGCERRVVYDFVNVVNGEATLKQALIKDKRLEKLYLLASPPTPPLPLFSPPTPTPVPIPPLVVVFPPPPFPDVTTRILAKVVHPKYEDNAGIRSR